ncbi:MAG: hypothetical protein GC202_10315 [Alphaproteobacteria bacterium]|nr:hypothetical protein [Alphaproteobacteria bacterium]
MIRALFEVLLPLILPVFVYAAWMAMEKRRAEKLGHGEAPTWAEAPWVWLSLAGLILAGVATMGTVLMQETSAPRGTYVAPYVGEDGAIVPGHVERK